MEQLGERPWEAILSSVDLARTAAARDRQTLVGLALAAMIVGGWLALHVASIFVIDWSALPVVAPFVAIVVQTWLCVGLFIVAHDCMHGSLAPGRPWLNRAVGRLCLFLYAGFIYDRLLPAHHRHHRRPGTPDDPDYNPDDPSAFWPWFGRFMSHYFGWREGVVLGTVVTVYLVVLRPELPLFLAFFALPAILSALQLFYFGTYRPHRAEELGFVDHHNSRSDGFPWFVSLMTCFHFGYHHEHHLSPTTPWWRLPALRSRMEGAASA